MANQEKTHFGFQEVPVDQKKDWVGNVFSSVAGRYDLMNDLMSVGLHRVWKQYFVRRLGIAPNASVLDLAGGTGDITARIVRRMNQQGRVCLTDINRSMVQQGRHQLINKGIVKQVDYVIADAESLSFPENTFDCVTMAFGLRNVTDQLKALRSIYHVLKPGGYLHVLEFSKPVYGWMKSFYDAYSFNVIPKIGKWIAGDESSYRYLVESIRRHPDQERLKLMFREAGFQMAEYENLNGGIVAIHRGIK